MVPSSSRRGRNRNACLLGLAILAISCSPPQAERISIWDASDESNVARIDHGPWQDLLDGYVSTDRSGVNVVEYAALAGNPADAATLAGYLEFLQAIDPRDYSRAEQMAYWINLYNALTVKVVLDAYPVDSIKEIHEGVVPLTGPWNDVHANVAGEDLTLDHIEHGILRPIWRDRRIHYAVNCAAYGCPHLIKTAFTADNTESLLERGARAYVNNPRGVDVVDDDFIVISSIYDWFAVDFGGTEEAVIEHLIDYSDSELAAFLEAFEGAIEYDYDWDLNEPQR
ncbi:MAG: DUF547 domain-containing protein [Acidobacteriia bacterium]|nr:DUF547 domain-containing protein [Terriglobia bacterium]MYG03673.1 DUF547 domain-containing protein [Terriglobia bacterium]MYK10848.1 DUF547 domain-containing protein [Terriglobia bacterium]